MPGNDTNTKLLVRATGADASTGFTDVSASARTLTANGSCQVDTAIKKFTASTMLETSGDNLAFTLDAGGFGTGDFTIDLWVYFSSVSGTEAIVGPTTSVNTAVSMRRNGTNIDAYITAGGEYILTSGVTLATGTWYHVALQRVGSTGRVFIDGTQRGTASSWNVDLSHTAYAFGKERNGFNAANMQQEEQRISNNARYPNDGSGFTPPTAPYSSSVTLTADAGAYTYSGVSAVLNAGKTLTAEAAAYVYTGVAATLSAVRTLVAATGSYAYTGIDAFLAKGKLLVAEAGAYTYTGVATLMKLSMAAVTGIYTYTGIAAAFSAALSIKVDAGTYTYTGVTASLVKGLNLVAGTGSYILTGLANIFARAIRKTKYLVARRNRPRLKHLPRMQDPTLKE